MCDNWELWKVRDEVVLLFGLGCRQNRYGREEGSLLPVMI